MESDLFESNIYDTGLNRKDWNLLKDAILCAGECPEFPSKDFDGLPPYLQNHRIGRLIALSLAGEPKVDLNDAAKLMVGGLENAWLALSKS